MKDVTFEQNLLDKTEWQPIDDKIVTEIHEKYQILPCAFPHVEYTRDHKLQPLKDESVKYTKIKRPAQKRKICPVDDSIDIMKRVQSMNKMSQMKAKSRKLQKRQRKRLVARVKQAANKNAAKAEVNEFNAVKNLFTDGVNQNSTSSTNTESIALRTRRNSKCTISTEKPQIQPNPRRSQRMSMSK